MQLVAAFTAVLSITLSPQGPNGPVQHWTVRCPGSKACTRLQAGGRALFRPVPRGMACTQIYGGPDVARMRGTLNGRSVRATFTRRDGCQIARWNRVQFLFRK